MASSDYYYNLYRTKKKEANKYEGDEKDLQKILGNLTGEMNDEIRAINNEINDLKDDLDKSVRHNAAFTKGANDVAAQKEVGVTLDTSLSVAVSELEEEIRRVNGLNNNAIRDRDYYWNKYEEKKAEERQAFLNKLIGKDDK